MTKEQFCAKWEFSSYWKADLDAVIAHEIAKVQEAKPQPALNEIEKAYHNYEPIRYILWNEGWNIKKHSDTESIDRNGKIYDNKSIVFNFDTSPEEWELYTEPTDQVTDHEQPELNPIERAFNNYEPIRLKKWNPSDWIKKHSNSQIITNLNNIYDINEFDFDSIKTSPEKWELYTEPTEQPSSQAKLDNSFDKERFEAMFRAVVASEPHWTYKDCMIETEKLLTQLDSFYFEKTSK